MSVSRANYQLIEKEYVTTDIGLRDLSAKHSLSMASVASYSRTHAWVVKRNTFKAEKAQRAVDRVMNAEAALVADVHTEGLAVALKTIRRYSETLDGTNFVPTMKDAEMAVKVALLLAGQVTERKEERHVLDGITINAFSPAELQGLLAATAPKLVGPGASNPAGSSPEGPSAD